MFLNTVLVVLTDLAASFLGNSVFRRHFHLLLSVLLMFGPGLSFWVSQHSIFAKRTHFMYRIFLRSGWGWTCVFVGSFVFVLSFSIRRSLTLSLRHLSRLLLAGGLWLGFCKLLDLLENATGSCYEPLVGTSDVTSGLPLLVLHEGEIPYTAFGRGFGLLELEGPVPGMVPDGSKLVLSRETRSWTTQQELLECRIEGTL
ncbi:unnamed protein product [Knipowitschia caucasica]|uniref:Uncharacterized protein n=1 Tax=Knipowitschia caucasica TaxID=637954 RepID=A0AAV2JRT9_KNICA